MDLPLVFSEQEQNRRDGSAVVTLGASKAPASIPPILQSSSSTWTVNGELHNSLPLDFPLTTTPPPNPLTQSPPSTPTASPPHSHPPPPSTQPTPTPSKTTTSAPNTSTTPHPRPPTRPPSGLAAASMLCPLGRGRGGRGHRLSRGGCRAGYPSELLFRLGEERGKEGGQSGEEGKRGGGKEVPAEGLYVSRRVGRSGDRSRWWRLRRGVCRSRRR